MLKTAHPAQKWRRRSKFQYIIWTLSVHQKYSWILGICNVLSLVYQKNWRWFRYILNAPMANEMYNSKNGIFQALLSAHQMCCHNLWYISCTIFGSTNELIAMVYYLIQKQFRVSSNVLLMNLLPNMWCTSASNSTTSDLFGLKRNTKIIESFSNTLEVDVMYDAIYLKKKMRRNQ